MPCLNPILIANPATNGGRDLRKKRIKTYSDKIDILLNDAQAKRIRVPCGKCVGCMQIRINNWVFRHLLQLKESLTAHFVTLTYNDEHIPINLDGSLHFEKAECQKFIKRLRYYLAEYDREKILPPLKYHLVAEYGDTFKRPHYHMILYNYPNIPTMLDKIPQTWNKGSCHIGEVNEKSIRYVIKYITQFYYEEKFPNENENPFSLYSNTLGSASYRNVADYLYESKKNLYPIDGKFYKVPQSYLAILVNKGYISEDLKNTLSDNAQEYYEQTETAIRDDCSYRGIPYTHVKKTYIENKSRQSKRKYRLTKE